MHGPVALVGSGEFLEVMRPVDQRLLERRPQRAVFLPTAAAEEGDERVAYWLDLGTRHFASMGVEPVPLAVLDRADAQRQDLADLVAGAGLVYLSGGNPGYLADTLRSTVVWQAIVDAWQAGSALAGCSAGACALGAVSDDFRRPGRFSGLGLGVVPHLAAIPHFDRFDSLAPDLAGSLVAAAPDGVTVVGVDEDTALVGGLEQWKVEGRQAVWTIGRTGSRTRYGPDQTVHLPLAPPPH